MNAILKTCTSVRQETNLGVPSPMLWRKRLAHWTMGGLFAVFSLGSALPNNTQAASTGEWLNKDEVLSYLTSASWSEAAKIQEGADVSVLVNGSFETGDYTGWTLFEDSGIPDWGTWGIATHEQLIQMYDMVFDFFDQTEVHQYSPGLPHTYTATNGNFVALQLQDGPERHRMSQDVTVTCAGTTTLSWDMEFKNHAGAFEPEFQFLAVHIRDVNTDTILKTLFKTRHGVDPQEIPMTTFTADISEFAGLTVRVDVDMQVQLFYFDAAFDNFLVKCDTSVLISPPSGAYMSTQHFQLGLIVKALDGQTATVTDVRLNGENVTTAFKNCVKGTLASGGETFRCPAILSRMLGVGSHQLDVTVGLSDGQILTDSVTWDVLENREGQGHSKP